MTSKEATHLEKTTFPAKTHSHNSPERKSTRYKEMQFNENRLRAILVLLLIALSMGVSATAVRAQSCATELLTEPWELRGDGGTSDQVYQEIDPMVLQGKDTVRVTFNPHDTQRLLTIQESKDASVLIFSQNDWNVSSIVEDGFNGPDWPTAVDSASGSGELTVDIPLAAFEGIGSAAGVPFAPHTGVDGSMSFRLWNSEDFQLTIKNVSVFDSSTCDLPPADHEIQYRPQVAAVIESAAPEPAVDAATEVNATETETEPAFEIRSVSTMKLTKDTLGNPPSDEDIDKVISKIVALNANYVAIETPYDSPPHLDAVGETYRWIEAVRASNGLKIHHRHMFGHMEGIYDMEHHARVFGEDIDPSLQSIAMQIKSVPYDQLDQYMVQMYQYILNNRTMFENEDIFTPFPEPDVRGIGGYHDCVNSFCLWASAEDFSQGLVNYSLVAKEAFEVLGLQVSVGHYGINGYVAAGLGNADRLKTKDTALSCEAIEAMDGKVHLDHYTDAESMAADLQYTHDVLEEKCPAEFESLEVGEYGISDPAALREVLGIFAAAGMTEINIWSIAHGDTGLLDSSLEETPLYPVVQDFYTRSAQNVAEQESE